MSIKKRTYIANFLLLLLPVCLMIAFYKSTGLSVLPSLMVILFWLAAGTVFLVNILVTFFMTKSITDPINKIIYATQEIKKGNLDYVINYDIQDEFYDLFKEFDQMRVALKKSIFEIQKNNAEKKQLTDSIVHDLKTPISTILGYSQALIDDIANSEEKKKIYLQTINEKTFQIDKLVNNLFLLSKLENKCQNIEMEFVKISELKKYFEEIIFDLEEQNINCSLDFKIENDIGIRIDFSETKRVFQNVIENSIKYKSNKPLELNIFVWENDRKVVIKISDNGIGIEKGKEEIIFERFFRTDEARTSNGGSGLGLTTSKNIIENQNGEIWCRGNKNTGLSIYISFLKEFTKNEEDTNN